MRKKGLWLLMLLALLCFPAGCGSSAGGSAEEETSTGVSSESSTQGVPDDVVVDAAVDDMLSQMSQEEKIGQLFFVCTDSLDQNSSKEFSDRMQDSLERFHPGGIIFFSYNMEEREQTKQLISDLQQASDVPLFIGVDEEGGTVSRVSGIEAMEMTPIASMYEIGSTGDSAKAYDTGKTIADQITELGFNLDFAPVADLCDPDENTEIGTRSFGSDASLVSDMVSEEVKGLQENGLSAALKHFPGQGSVAEDTHKGYANLDTTIDDLRDYEFKPFEKGIQAGADFVMMSHISVESITQTETPASLSELMVTDILREELGFRNIIITDAMNMKVITKFYEPGQAALQAIEAGVDMILMPDNLEEAYTAVEDALDSGDLTEKRLDASVRRILTVKIKRGIISLDQITEKTD